MTQRNDKVTATVQVGGMINYTPCSVEVGEVTTLPAGSDATVTNSGNEYEAVFDFGIPQGAKGDTGETGATGKSAYESAVEQGYEGTEEEFATSLTTVDTKAAQAAASATAAANSATSASNSATSASNSATTATTKASEASASATSAAASATSAGSNATAAQNYVTQASTFASNAANSATNAASYASNAAASATNASAMASSASTSASSASASADTASAVLTDPDFVAVAGAVEDITTVATNISDVNTVGQAMEDVSSVADNISDITLVANDLENIDIVASGVAQWVKPADWIDIRSGAIPNSIYALVGHSADYSTCDNCGFRATLTNAAHSFNVYIDNNLYGTYTSGTSVTWSWSTLALTSGSTTTTPAAFNTHIIRITPTTSEGVFKKFEVVKKSSNREVQGWLWVHFAIEEIEGVALQNYPNIKPTYLTAVTALGNNLHLTGNNQQCLLGGAYDLGNDISQNLAYLPTIEVDNLISATGMFNFSGPLKKAKLVVNGTFKIAAGGRMSYFCSHEGLEELDINKPIIVSEPAGSAFKESSLKRLPSMDVSATTDLDSFVTLNTKLEPTVLDFSTAKLLKKVGCYGSSAKRMTGLKGLLVSNEAPFDNTNSPQLKVDYTGLDRAALVNLFKSMPYNVGYTVVGSPTITDGVVSGMSNSNYTKTSLSFLSSYKTNFDIVIRAKKGSVSSQGQGSLFTMHNGTNSQGKFAAFFWGNNFKFYSAVETGYTNAITLTATFDSNTFYYLKVSQRNRTVTLSYSTDGVTWQGETSHNDFSYISASFPIDIGRNLNWGSGFAGEIDLNHTYININGVPWFTGKAAMTKTCSVVGCTGTANLTAEDKAIATDKGWALTLS